MKFPKEDEFDCFKLNHMTSGEVLKFDKIILLVLLISMEEESTGRFK